MHNISTGFYKMNAVSCVMSRGTESGRKEAAIREDRKSSDMLMITHVLTGSMYSSGLIAKGMCLVVPMREINSLDNEATLQHTMTLCASSEGRCLPS